jgi:hypothetical protein
MVRVWLSVNLKRHGVDCGAFRVIAGRFTLFRVVRIGVSAGQLAFAAGSIPGSYTRRAADQARVEVPHLSAAVPGAGVAALHPKLAVPLRRRQSKSNM